MKTALLIIDVQNEYFPGGKVELFKSIDASNNIKELLKDFRDKNLPIIHICHLSNRPGAKAFLPDTEGVIIHSNVKPVPGEKVFEKNFPNSFRNTGLNEYLNSEGIKRLIITGMMTHNCVDTTVRAAFDLGYDCKVVGDCCATKALNINGIEVSAENVQNAFLSSMNGSWSKVLSKDQVIELVK
jgi:nicotinamidase-related amidase